jgi:hypothetical protein
VTRPYPLLKRTAIPSKKLPVTSITIREYSENSARAISRQKRENRICANVAVNKIENEEMEHQNLVFEPEQKMFVEVACQTGPDLVFTSDAFCLTDPVLKADVACSTDPVQKTNVECQVNFKLSVLSLMNSEPPDF